jgi:hypothetical protein
MPASILASIPTSILIPGLRIFARLLLASSMKEGN